MEQEVRIVMPHTMFRVVFCLQPEELTYGLPSVPLVRLSCAFSEYLRSRTYNRRDTSHHAQLDQSWPGARSGAPQWKATGVPGITGTS